MSNIVLRSKDASLKFQKGEVVFRIISSKPQEEGEDIVSDKGIVTSLADYEKLISKHQYISLIHLAPLVYKIAYVCGCLNLEKGIQREETFTFLFRELQTHEWKEWFIVQPYSD